MYSAIYSFCIFFSFVASVQTAPVIFQHVSEVSLIISNSCMAQNSSVTPSDAMSSSIVTSSLTSRNEVEQMSNMEKYLNESYHLSQEIQKNHSDWLTHFAEIISPIKQLISVSPVRHCQLSLEQNSHLHLLTQHVIFPNYFRSQEHDDVYPDDMKTGLIKLKNILYQAICQLKNELLKSSVSIRDIEKYISEDHKQNWLTLDGEKGAIKRAFVMTELKILSQFLENVRSTVFAMRNIFSLSKCD